MNFYAPKARTHNEDDYRELLEQVQQLQAKLSTKTETLLRVGQDLERLENERNVSEARAKTFERNLERAEAELQRLTTNEQSLTASFAGDRSRLQAEIGRLKIEVSSLRSENAELKAEKKDLQKDCKTLRQQIAKHEVSSMMRQDSLTTTPSTPVPVSKHRDSRMSEDKLEKYEKLYEEHKQMERDLQCVLGVKEELVVERDSLLKKIERLTSEMSYLLNGDPRRVAEDLDGLVAENRFLKAQLCNAQEESDTIKASLAKYRQVAEQAQPQQMQPSPSRKEDGTFEEKTSVAVINMKQIRELLTSHSIDLSDGDYRALSNILLDLCNDKQMALAHQRRANKILGNRLSEVETRLSQVDLLKSPRALSPRPADTAELSVDTT